VKEQAQSFLVGLASLGAVVGLAVLLLIFGELDGFIHPRYEVTIATNHAAGLRRGSSVELNGVPIGIIDEITATGEASFPVELVALIDSEITIPASSAPYAATSLLGGASVLELKSPAGGAPGPMLPTDGSARIEASIRFGMIEQITAALDSRMAPVMDALARFETLSATYIDLGRNLNDLVAPRGADAEPDAAPNVRDAVTKIYDILTVTEEAMTLARDWLGDEQLEADVRAAVEKALTLIDSGTATLDQYSKLAAGLETDIDTLLESIVPVTEEASRTLIDLRRLTLLASEGNGTVAQLLNNPDLYRSLDDAAKRLDEVLREAKLLLEKAKAEGLPIQF